RRPAFYCAAAGGATGREHGRARARCASAAAAVAVRGRRPLPRGSRPDDDAPIIESVAVHETRSATRASAAAVPPRGWRPTHLRARAARAGALFVALALLLLQGACGGSAASGGGAAAPAPPPLATYPPGTAVATFAAGCFWG